MDKRTKYGIRARIEAGPDAVPSEIRLTDASRQKVEQLFGPIKAELKAMGLPHTDLWWVVKQAEDCGYVVDDMT